MMVTEEKLTVIFPFVFSFLYRYPLYKSFFFFSISLFSHILQPCYRVLSLKLGTKTIVSVFYLGRKRTRVKQQRAPGCKQGAAREEAWLEDRSPQD